VTVHEGVEHSSPRGLSDGSCNSGGRDIGVVFDIHIVMVDELFLSRNEENYDLCNSHDLNLRNARIKKHDQKE
jgi:hypothetical protein